MSFPFRLNIVKLPTKIFRGGEDVNILTPGEGPPGAIRVPALQAEETFL
jgi:hypothetical protein